MLEQILTYLHNWFLIPNGVHEGDFVIKNGSISLPFLQNMQYFRICGSVFNDGLHQYPESVLTDEKFSGTVWALAIPNEVISLADEIITWKEKNSDIIANPYQSESFGGYSYTKATDPKTGGLVTWQSVFSSQLDAYKKPKELGFVKPNTHTATNYFVNYKTR